MTPCYNVWLPAVATGLATKEPVYGRMPIVKITVFGGEFETVAGDEVERSMIKVKSRSNESVEQMLRRFKKLCEKEGLTKEMKRTSYYEKPSERRRRRLRKAVKREQKNLQIFTSGVSSRGPAPTR